MTLSVVLFELNRVVLKLADGWTEIKEKLEGLGNSEQEMRELGLEALKLWFKEERVRERVVREREAARRKQLRKLGSTVLRQEGGVWRTSSEEGRVWRTSSEEGEAVRIQPLEEETEEESFREKRTEAAQKVLRIAMQVRAARTWRSILVVCPWALEF